MKLINKLLVNCKGCHYYGNDEDHCPRDGGLLSCRDGGIWVEDVVCNHQQQSDQMTCTTCGMTWDVNDQHPPACPQRRLVDSTQMCIGCMYMGVPTSQCPRDDQDNLLCTGKIWVSTKEFKLKQVPGFMCDKCCLKPGTHCPQTNGKLTCAVLVCHYTLEPV